MFLLSYRNTHLSLRELKKAVETLACWLMFPQHFSFSQTSTCVSIAQKKQGTCFYFLNNVPLPTLSSVQFLYFSISRRYLIVFTWKFRSLMRIPLTMELYLLDERSSYIFNGKLVASLMVSVVSNGSSGPHLSARPGHCAFQEFLDQMLFSH